MSDALAHDVWGIVRRDLSHFASQLDPPPVVREDSVLLLSGGPTADFNIAALEAGANVESVLRDFAALVRGATVPALFMSPGANGPRLDAVARAEGLTSAGSAPLMLLDDSRRQSTSPSTGPFGVERVGDLAGLRVVADLIAEAFGLDRVWVGRTFAAPALLGASGVHFWLASREGDPYSTVTTVQSGDATVGVWSMATRPARQRQGAGRALLEHVLHHYRREGIARFYLIATPDGKPLYDSIGFTTIEDLSIYVAGHSQQFGQH